jgi:hypothetical protein
MILLYLDPGSGSFLIQLLIAALAGAGIIIGANWSKLKRWLGKKKKKNETEDEDDDDEQQPGA